jgi:hypothetical protein
MAPPLLPMASDSLPTQALPPPIAQADSTGIAPKTAPPILLPPPGKKPRGTQGIKDSDYRFITGRDST